MTLSSIFYLQSCQARRCSLSRRSIERWIGRLTVVNHEIVAKYSNSQRASSAREVRCPRHVLVGFRHYKAECDGLHTVLVLG